jgi:hypothetical protein
MRPTTTEKIATVSYLGRRLQASMLAWNGGSHYHLGQAALVILLTGGCHAD